MIKSRRMIRAGHVALIGSKGNSCKILVEKTERKRPLRRPRRKWAEKIKMDLREIGWGAVD
jgi:hypothetical protein